MVFGRKQPCISLLSGKSNAIPKMPSGGSRDLIFVMHWEEFSHGRPLLMNNAVCISSIGVGKQSDNWSDYSVLSL